MTAWCFSCKCSLGFESIRLGRKFFGIELKESYFKQAVANLQAAQSLTGQFDFTEVPA